MIYLTYSDQPSGVFSSQVIDVCHYLNSEFHTEIKLISFISVRNFLENRSKIKKEFPNACVLPALPTMLNWQFSIPLFILLCIFMGERNVISRNVLATLIALSAKKLGVIKTVVYDGRGAMAAEWNEYQVVHNDRMQRKIGAQERRVVLKSDYRIAVSEKLINHWREKYNYTKTDHIVIPCTLGSGFLPFLPEENQLINIRIDHGFDKNDIILVYSGSTAGWQSFNSIAELFSTVLNSNTNIKLLFLSREDINISEMKQKYPKQVFSKWVNHNEVQQILFACDYGILFRDQSITNKVAAPTKFAEYLSAGLSIIISENLGDYSDFVKNENCGIVSSKTSISGLSCQSYSQKQLNTELAKRYFTKQAHRNSYKKLIEQFNSI